MHRNGSRHTQPRRSPYGSFSHLEVLQRGVIESNRGSGAGLNPEVQELTLVSPQFGRRRVRKPSGAPLPKPSFKPKRQPRRGWQPQTRV